MTPIHFDAGGTLVPGLNKVRNATDAPIPPMTRVAALDRRVDPHLAAASGLLGTVIGAAAALGFLAGRITAPRRNQ